VESECHCRKELIRLAYEGCASVANLAHDPRSVGTSKFDTCGAIVAPSIGAAYPIGADYVVSSSGRYALVTSNTSLIETECDSRQFNNPQKLDAQLSFTTEKTDSKIGMWLVNFDPSYPNGHQLLHESSYGQTSGATTSASFYDCSSGNGALAAWVITALVAVRLVRRGARSRMASKALSEAKSLRKRG